MRLLIRLELRRFDFEYGLDHDRCADGRAVDTVHDADVSRIGAEKLDKEVRSAPSATAECSTNSFVVNMRTESFTSFLSLSKLPTFCWAAAKAFNAAKRAASRP